MYWRAQQAWYLKQNSENVLPFECNFSFTFEEGKWCDFSRLDYFLRKPLHSFISIWQLLSTGCSSCILPKKLVAWEDPQDWFNYSPSSDLQWKGVCFFGFFYQPDSLHFPDTTLIARKGAVQGKYVPIGTFCISSHVHYEAFGRIFHSQQMQLGKECSCLVWHFAMLLNI